MGQTVTTVRLPSRKADRRQPASPRSSIRKRSGSFDGSASPCRSGGVKGSALICGHVAEAFGRRTRSQPARGTRGSGGHGARQPCATSAALLASAGQRRERYLRRLGIRRLSDAGGQALPTPQGGRPQLAREVKELALEYEALDSSSDSVKVDSVQDEDCIVDSSDEEIPYRKDSDGIGAESTLTVNSGAGATASFCKSDIVMEGKTHEDHARMKFLQKLSYERVWIPKAQRPPSHQTLIIFDWDDTLLCTSFLNRQHGKPLSENVRQQLQAIERADAKLLKMAQSMGQTFIITNAISGWVESSAKAWAPSLVPLLEKVNIISARSRYEAEYPHDVWKWKAEMFLEVRRRLNSQVITNLISLGDSEYEMEATQTMGKEFQQASIKLIKFTESPQPDELLKQLELVTDEFDRIVGKARNLRVRLQRPPRH